MPNATGSTDMKAIIKKLIEHPDEFTSDDAECALYTIMSGTALPSQIAAFLIALRLQDKDRDPSIVQGCAKAVRAHANMIPFDGFESLRDSVVDIVGTGGDGHDTYNVSTTASIVAAGAGVKVAKHGNRAASSRSGSADLIESQGCDLQRLKPSDVAQLLNESNFCFLFSQVHHPAMKHVAAIRKEIGVHTVFNLLGPMCNPACPKRMVVGVHSPWIGAVMADALRLAGAKEALVVCGAEHLDEISPAGDTHYWRVHPDGTVTTGVLHPTRDFGLDTYPLSSVKGGDCHENSVILNRLLNDELDANDPILNFVLLNTSALLVVSGIAEDFRTGVAMARESISSGKAKESFESYKARTLSNIK